MRFSVLPLLAALVSSGCALPTNPGQPGFDSNAYTLKLWREMTTEPIPFPTKALTYEDGLTLARVSCAVHQDNPRCQKARADREYRIKNRIPLSDGVPTTGEGPAGSKISTDVSARERIDRILKKARGNRTS